MNANSNQPANQDMSPADKRQRLARRIGATVFYVVAFGLHIGLGLLGEYLNDLSGSLAAELPFWVAQFAIILVVVLPLVAHLSKPNVRQEIKASSLWRISQAIRAGFAKPFQSALDKLSGN